MPDISIATLLAAVKAVFEADKKLREKTKGFDPFKKATNKYLEGVLATCDRMKIFGMTEPVSLQGIYVRVNILEKLTRLARLTPEDLEEAFDKDQRGFGKQQSNEPRLGLEIVKEKPKLFVLGKPGAGKTTFLKFTALQALRSDTFDKPHIPVFIRLREWADVGGSLLDFIVRVFDTNGYPEAKAFAERMLKQGRGLILLDGLDEVTGDRTKAIQEIERFCNKYRKNRFVMSCRIAASDYVFESFADVEMADFDDEQIQSFSTKWFSKQPKKATTFWNKLNRPENKPIKELAGTPLLLTMLCLTFDEVQDFPKNRAELYKESIDALLKKWDSSRSIEREGIYKNLSLQHKEALLSRIAVQTFAQDQYFIHQDRMESLIQDLIEHLPDVDADLLHADAEAVFKTIEAQHGLFVERAHRIYSFSHLTFQEYFTARYIVDHRNEGTLERLLDQHLGNDKWLEVILLVAGMLPEADDFLITMRNKISQDVSQPLADFLNDAASIVKPNTQYSQAALRAIACSYILFSGLTTFLVVGYDLAVVLDPALKDCSRREPDHFFNPKHVRFFNPKHVRVIEDSRSVGDASKLASELELGEYLFKNKFLVSCLNMGCYISRETRQHLLDTLLLEPWMPPERPSKPEVLF